MRLPSPTSRALIPEHRLVPFDNNIGQRNVHPVLPSIRYILKLLGEPVIWVRNPLKMAVACRIEIELPRFLRRLGWEMRVVSAGGRKFELGPRDRREVVFSIEPGEKFSPEMVERAIAEGEHEIKILTYLEDELSGGMTYQLSFDADDREGRYPREDEKPEDEPRRPLTIEEILKILAGRLPITRRPVLERRIRTVRLELDLSDDSD
jgi:hypothetical protein